MATTTKAPKKQGDETGTEDKKTVYCQLPTSIHSAISDAAEREYRSISAQMEMIATQWVAANTPETAKVK